MVRQVYEKLNLLQNYGFYIWSRKAWDLLRIHSLSPDSINNSFKKHVKMIVKIKCIQDRSNDVASIQETPITRF